MSPRTWIIVGATFGALAVATGAFGAHALKERLETSGRTDVYETAVRYQMYHALALVLVGLLGMHMPAPTLNVAGLCFTAGIVIFSGPAIRAGTRRPEDSRRDRAAGGRQLHRRMGGASNCGARKKIARIVGHFGR